MVKLRSDLRSRTTSHISPLRASYGVYFVNSPNKNDRDISGMQCTPIYSQPDRSSDSCHHFNEIPRLIGVTININIITFHEVSCILLHLRGDELIQPSIYLQPTVVGHELISLTTAVVMPVFQSARRTTLGVNKSSA